jgi:hypothetical protein
LALGLAGLYYAGRFAADMVAQAKTAKKVRARQARAKANIKRFEEKYPEVRMTVLYV